MKTRFWASALILFVCMVNAGCKKTAVNASTNNNAVPIHTAVGTPNGNPVTTTISSSGGKIISADSMVELQFPNGALSANTQITIQPITNNAPNGLGNAYRFLPDGLKFSKPVILVFHYTYEQIAGTISDLLGTAFQDSSGIWYGLGSVTVDTINKIISAPINHFSDWTIFSALSLTPVNTKLKVSQSIELTLKGVHFGSPLAVFLTDDDLSNVGKFFTKTWTVNNLPKGNSTYGKITGVKYSNYGALSATYTAPSKVPPSGNPVVVKITLTGIFLYNGKTESTLEVETKILIYDGKRYKIDIMDDESNIIGTGQTYTDAAVLTATLAINRVTNINKDSIKNFPPALTPKSILFDGCTWTWEPDPIGTINIQSAAVFLTEKNNVDKLDLVLDNTGAVSPLFHLNCSGSLSNYQAQPPPDKMFFTFPLHDPETIVISNGGIQFKFTLLE